MGLNDNPAVKKAYEDRSYTDAKGNQWRRGMDGWFLDDAFGPGTVLLTRHQEFVDFIEQEHPVPAPERVVFSDYLEERRLY